MSRPSRGRNPAQQHPGQRPNLLRRCQSTLNEAGSEGGRAGPSKPDATSVARLSTPVWCSWDGARSTVYPDACPARYSAARNVGATATPCSLVTVSCEGRPAHLATLSRTDVFAVIEQLWSATIPTTLEPTLHVFDCTILESQRRREPSQGVPLERVEPLQQERCGRRGSGLESSSL